MTANLNMVQMMAPITLLAIAAALEYMSMMEFGLATILFARTAWMINASSVKIAEITISKKIEFMKKMAISAVYIVMETMKQERKSKDGKG